jgi:hypothetical protein
VTIDTALRSPYLIVDDFMPAVAATAMRVAMEAHLGHPFKHTPKTHMVWDYWHVPGLYTYLRTLPELIIGDVLAKAFHEHLTQWSQVRLGLAPRPHSYLSLYVNGCRQNQHNDAGNGRFGFVYSLTRNDRKTSGGETLIWREDATRTLFKPTAGEGFYSTIEPRFNRLLIFDDRLPHAVQLVEGNMEPAEGRIVIHGHLVESGPLIQGPLAEKMHRDVVRSMLNAVFDKLGISIAAYHGIAVACLAIEPDGSVAANRLMVERVRKTDERALDVEPMLADLLERLGRLCFPKAPQGSILKIPIPFGGSMSSI